MKVSDVMNSDSPRLRLQDTIEVALEMLINHPFVCVEDENGIFEGIITRRALLKIFQEKLIQ